MSSLLEVLGLKKPKNRPAPLGTDAPPDDLPPQGTPQMTAQDPRKGEVARRWGQLGGAAGPVLERLKDGGLMGAPGAVYTAALGAQTAHEDARKAIQAKDYGQAVEALDRLESQLVTFQTEFKKANDAAKIDFAKAQAALKAAIDRWDAAIAAQSLGKTGEGPFGNATSQYTIATERIAAALKDDNHVLAKRELRALENAIGAGAAAVNELRADLAQRKAAADGALAAAAQLGAPGAQAQAVGDAVKAAGALIDAVLQSLALAPVQAALAAIDSAAETCRRAAGRAFIATAQAKPKAARAQAMALLRSDAALLRGIADEQGGPALLDAMVQDLGGKAKDADSKKFVRAAIEARFGPKLGDTDLTTKYLPRLYDTLGKVPASHTVGNPMLKLINRKRVALVPEGSYSDGKGVVDLEAPRTGLVDAIGSFGAAVLPKKLTGANIVKGVGISLFDVLTLHEVGHSVDDSKQFMNGRIGNATFGGWQLCSFEQIVSLVAEGKGLYTSFPSLPRDFLWAYLAAVLQKKKPESEGSVRQKAGGATPDWKALARHAAVDTAEHIRLKSESSGLWEGGDSAAKKYAIDGVVYQQAYSDQWIGYQLSARSIKVSDYQFRAEGEWYAEAYAAFFLGKLKTSHPLHALLSADQAAGQSAQRAAR